MKITIVQGPFLPVPPVAGGAGEKVWFALGQEFARRGHEVTHVSRAYPGLPAREEIAGVVHRRVSGFSQPRSLPWLKALDLWYSLRVRALLPPADILVTHTFWLPVVARGQRRTGRLYVHVGRYPRGQGKLYRHAARLQTISSPIVRALIEQEPGMKEKIALIPIPLPNGLDDPEPGEESRERIMLYVGRIHPEKGLDLLVEAFARFARGNADWRLVVIGPWKAAQGGGGASYWNELRARAAPLGGRVEWAGPVFDAAALANGFRRAALFLYPSLAERGETFGLAPLEAMAQGCPPLVSALECFRDFIADGEDGFIFDHRAPDPVAALADRLAALTADPAGLRAAGENARRKAQDYQLGPIAERYLADFAAVLSENP